MGFKTTSTIPERHLFTFALFVKYVTQQHSILWSLKKYTERIIAVRLAWPHSSIVVDKTSYPARRTPGGMPAAAGFLLQLMRAQLTAKTKPLKEYRVIEKRYRPAIGTVCHVPLLQFEDGCF